MAARFFCICILRPQCRGEAKVPQIKVSSPVGRNIRPIPHPHPPSSFGTGGGFSSFFQDLFGSAGRGHTHGFGRQSSGEMNANVNIDLYTAMLGGEVMIQLSTGAKIKLKVKPETQPGTKVRLRGKGYDRGDGTFGDLIITYQVKLPTHLTDRQRELLRQMQAG